MSTEKFPEIYQFLLLHSVPKDVDGIVDRSIQTLQNYNTSPDVKALDDGIVDVYAYAEDTGETTYLFICKNESDVDIFEDYLDIITKHESGVKLAEEERAHLRAVVDQLPLFDQVVNSLTSACQICEIRFSVINNTSTAQQVSNFLKLVNEYFPEQSTEIVSIITETETFITNKSEPGVIMTKGTGTSEHKLDGLGVSKDKAERSLEIRDSETPVTSGAIVIPDPKNPRAHIDPNYNEIFNDDAINKFADQIYVGLVERINKNHFSGAPILPTLDRNNMALPNGKIPYSGIPRESHVGDRFKTVIAVESFESTSDTNPSLDLVLSTRVEMTEVIRVLDEHLSNMLSNVKLTEDERNTKTSDLKRAFETIKDTLELCNKVEPETTSVIDTSPVDTTNISTTEGEVNDNQTTDIYNNNEDTTGNTTPVINSDTQVNIVEENETKEETVVTEDINIDEKKFLEELANESTSDIEFFNKVVLNKDKISDKALLEKVARYDGYEYFTSGTLIQKPVVMGTKRACKLGIS